jgi:mRNA (2'-O-methyladenosine-N6-)-methyltransferase
VKYQQSLNPSVQPRPCHLVHFRPLIRPHTDPALGHCSYLNTCYSEPTYAQSPSIPPFPSSSAHPQNSNQRGAVSLPSGLGAGGRGKEKAPCRYLHYEVDWDGDEGAMGGSSGHRINGTVRPNPRANFQDHAKDVDRKKPYRLGIGMGPDGRHMKVVSSQVLFCGNE